jgi:competence protein ComEC
MSFVAGLFFFAIRGGLALFETLALNWPIKKWTAALAILATFFYLLISGVLVPTQRRFFMILLVLIGIVLDRQAVSMRLVAWAATAILLIQPESLLGASFQMSFAAVIALVAAYEAGRGRLTRWKSGGGWWRGLLISLGGVAFTSLVASLATAPFGIEHFNRFNPYGIAANMICVPLTGFIVMPAVLLAFLLMPLGLEGLALKPMGWGVEIMNEVARQVASWPGAGLSVPSFPAGGFALVLVGGLFLCLWRGRARLCGLALVLAGYVTLAAAKPPDILVDGMGQVMAARDGEGRLRLSSSKAGMLGEAWTRRNAGPLPSGKLESSEDGSLSCDRLGCLVTRQGRTVLLARHLDAVAEECKSAPD